MKPRSHLLPILVLVAVMAVASFALAHFIRDRSASAKAKQMKNPVASDPTALAEGKRSYAGHCQRCHGEKGDGRGEKAAELSVAPSDFTDAAEMGRLADGELFEEITEGKSPMPAFWDKLSEQERWQLVDYIRTFASKTAAAP